MISHNLIRQLDIQGPRYTSYPTAPQWGSIDSDAVTTQLTDWSNCARDIALYIHIPFCKSMCYYCGCNVIVRKGSGPEVGNEYVNLLISEIKIIESKLKNKPVIRQIHLGGGTPTFLSDAQLETLLTGIKSRFTVDGELAIEVDPRTMTADRMAALSQMGFNRLSLGVQDFDPSVQSAINRDQPYDMVENVTEWARAYPFMSLNYDLIYGLPRQTRNSIQTTVDRVIELKPDRIACYSYAHIPWLKSQQNLIPSDELPMGTEKMELFLTIRDSLLANGYIPIGMDHFALPTDALAIAYTQNTMSRNFMGYTVTPVPENWGIGLTSIGFFNHMYTQNVKTLPAYRDAIHAGQLPVSRGCKLSEDDKIRNWVIGELMCQFQLDKQKFCDKFSVNFSDYFDKIGPHLDRCTELGLITESAAGFQVTDLGKLFVRNVAIGFDAYLVPGSVTQYSRTI